MVSLTGIQLIVRSQVPDYYRLQIHGRNFSEELIYATDLILCENLTLCNEFSVDDGIIDLAIPSSISQV